MRNIGKSQIYIVPELTAGNEQWINPGFGNPDLQAHYDYIKRMVKEKTGRAMQERRERKRQETGKSPRWLDAADREGVLLIRPDTTLADVCKFGGVPETLGHHSLRDLPAKGWGLLRREQLARAEGLENKVRRR